MTFSSQCYRFGEIPFRSLVLCNGNVFTVDLKCPHHFNQALFQAAGLNSSVVCVKEAWKSKHMQTFNLKERDVSVVVWNIKGSPSDKWRWSGHWQIDNTVLLKVGHLYVRACAGLCPVWLLSNDTICLMNNELYNWDWNTQHDCPSSDSKQVEAH